MKYPGKESIMLEFKQQLPSNQQITKTITAFCNGFGGKLIVGVEDNGNICGVNEQTINDVSESLEQAIFDSCSPTIIPSVYSQRIADKLIIIIEVSSGMNKPYFIKKHGLNDGVFIRVGAHTVKAQVAVIQELTWKSKGFAADEIPVYSANEGDLDVQRFESFLKDKRSQYKKGQIQKMLFQYGVLLEEHQKYYPTTAGILLFGKNREQFFPEAFVMCSHFKGVSGRTAIAAKDCAGHLMDQIDSALEFVESRLNQQYEITGARRKQRLEIPEVAIREVIINAIVHRDYQMQGSVKIAIYDDRVEVFSPGGFPGPLFADQLEQGITFVRNHVIGKIFREAGYIEKLGSGFLNLFNSYRERGLPLPEVVDGGSFIECVLPRPGKTARKYNKKSDDEERLIRLFIQADEIGVQDVVRHLSVSRQTASRRLSKLVSDEVLVRVGNGPAARYFKPR